MDRLKSVYRLIRFTPAIIWSLICGLFEWLKPRTWYAKDVSNDIILITGAGSGLGRAISIEYAKLNASLVLWDINEQGLEETKSLVDEIHTEFEAKLEKKNKSIEKRTCLTYLVDVSRVNEVQKFAEKVQRDLNQDQPEGRQERYVSVLVNNAGIYHGLLLNELTEQQIQRIFNINILAHFWTVRAFLPKMIEHEKGHIVEIASMGGIGGMLKQVDYCATKFATVGFEQSLSIELDHMGLGDKIYTTVVCPFFFNSNLFTGFDSKATTLMSSEFVARETVLTMRCNQSRVLLPKFKSYLLLIIGPFMPRQAIILVTKALGIDEGIKEIRGKAAALTSWT